MTASIDLRPEDRFLAGWRKLAPLPLPPATPFDKEAALKRLGDAKNARECFAALSLTPAVSEEEARFWLAVAGLATAKTKGAAFAKKVAKQPLDATPSVETTAEALRKNDPPFEPLAPLLYRLYPREQLFALLRLLWPAPAGAGADYRAGPQCLRFCRAFLRSVRPYMASDEVAAWQAMLRPLLAAAPFASGYVLDAPLYYLGRVFSVQPETDKAIAAYNQSLRYASYMGTYLDPFFLVGGASSAEVFLRETQRLELRPQTDEQITLMLAHLEHDALGPIGEVLKTATSQAAAEDMVRALSAVRSPALAGLMLELTQSPKAGAPARRWLDTHAEDALPVLVPAAAERGKVGEEALDWLRRNAKSDKRPLIDAELAKLKSGADRIRKAMDGGPAVAEMTERPEWLPAPAKGTKFPAWLDPSLLPALVIDGQRLPTENNATVVAALRDSTLEKPDPIVVKLKAHAEPRSLEAFGWELFTRWNENGGPSPMKWAMMALGLIGGDGVCLKIAPLIRDWPGQSQHQRAVNGLLVLRSIGSEQALMALHNCAEKSKFAGLKSKAQAFMGEIAAAKGLTQEQLADRIVPDFGLDATGRRAFDFGPRQFAGGPGPDLKPLVIDESRAVKKDLPKPTAKDDAVKAETAVAEWKLFKTQLKDVVKAQSARLEKSLKARRTWSKEEFEQFFLRHPLLGQLAQTLLWAVQPTARKVESLFRVNEERALVDQDGATVSLSDTAKVSIVHPILLPPEGLSAWQQVFVDYELMPPFPQLGRTLFRLEPGEAGKKYLERLKGEKAVQVALIGAFRNGNWEAVWNSGANGRHRKFYPEADTTAVVEYTPQLNYEYYGGGYGSEDRCEWLGCYFVKGSPNDPKPEDAMPAGEADPVVVHEVLGLMSGLAGKGK